MSTVIIGGEERRIAEYSAFKGIFAMDLISGVQAQFHEVLEAGAEFKRNYEATHYVDLPRATARQEFRPRPLMQEVPIERDGGIVMVDGKPALRREPVLIETDGVTAPLLGPDPLGHLTEDDWRESGQILRMPDSPDERFEMAAMVEAGFRLARESVLRLVALAITTNDDLEKWDREDGDTSIESHLDDVVKDVMHKASAAELVRLGVAIVEITREQLTGPFDDLMTAVRSLRKSPETPAETPVEPMRVVDAPETGSNGGETPARTSSGESPGDSGGPPTPSSTEPHSPSSAVSASA